MVPIKRIALANAVCKAIGFTAALYLTNMIWSGTVYQTLWPLIITALCLMVVGVVADLVIVPLLGAFWSLLPGLPGMMAILMVIGKVSSTAHVTWLQALTAAVIIAPLEYCLHRSVLYHLAVQA